MAHFLCHLGCSHFSGLLLDFYFTENIFDTNLQDTTQKISLLHKEIRECSIPFVPPKFVPFAILLSLSVSRRSVSSR